MAASKTQGKHAEHDRGLCKALWAQGDGLAVTTCKDSLDKDCFLQERRRAKKVAEEAQEVERRNDEVEEYTESASESSSKQR